MKKWAGDCGGLCDMLNGISDHIYIHAPKIVSFPLNTPRLLLITVSGPAVIITVIIIINNTNKIMIQTYWQITLHNWKNYNAFDSIPVSP